MTRTTLKEYGWAIGIIGAATGIALALRPYLQTIDVAIGGNKGLAAYLPGAVSGDGK